MKHNDVISRSEQSAIDVRQALSQRILILDGAMGTMIQRYRLTEADYRGERFADVEQAQRGNNDLLNLTHPEIVEEIHRAYLEAGADIIETNTFNSTSISMQDYGMQDLAGEMNYVGASIARRVVDAYLAMHPEKKCWVAGAIGPTNKTASMSPDVERPMYRAVTFEDLKEAYKTQVRELVRGGVDLLLIETIFDTLNAKAAVWAAEEVGQEVGTSLPIMLSATISDQAGRTLSGQTMGAFVASMSHAPILSIGLNCSFGADDMRVYIEELGRIAPYLISAYPNAGLPNALGEYDETPEKMAGQMRAFVDEGLVNIIGGCCGTTPEHIACYRELVAGKKPHKPSAYAPSLRLSGLELLELSEQSNFLNIGERCNVAGSRKFLRLIKEHNYEEALSIARQQVEDGAQVLDINMDDGLLESAEEMTNFLSLLASDPDIARVPLMIDSSNWGVLEAGLKCVQGKSIVNSISLKVGEAEFLRQAFLVRRYGAAVIVMAFDERGQADNYERRVEICQRAYNLLVGIGFPAEDIIFDPNVLAIATGIEEHRRYAIDFIETTRWIKQNLPGARVSGGVSNLSFALRGNNYIREAMHAIFLYHAIQAGMDMGIVNPAQSVQYEEIPPAVKSLIEDVIFDRHSDATDRLIDYARQAEEVAPSGAETQVEQWRSLPVGERLSHALVKGITTYLEEDIAQALTLYPKALDIIDQPLMAGMNYVGELFGSGRMFLPQVVKAARTMKRAVAILQPHIEEEQKQGGGKKAGKILLATVKGDVHDIGKNIVGIILACNNYEIIDLGVMVPPEKIIDTIRREQPDLVGLSGLITPSLEEMSIVAREMDRAGLRVPLLIGGATTSKLHTALKIEPMYRGGGVVYVRDASQLPAVASKLLSTESRESYLDSVRDEYTMLRERGRAKADRPLLSLSEARNRGLQVDWAGYTSPLPRGLGRTLLDFIPLETVVPYIDWTYFFHAWKIAPKFISVTRRDRCSRCRSEWLAGFSDRDHVAAIEAARLYDDALDMLEQMIRRDPCAVRAVLGLFAASSQGDTIYVDGVPLPMLRTQEPPATGLCLSLADFVRPQGMGRDYIGAFAVTAGEPKVYLDAMGLPEPDEYQQLLVKSLLDRLAEATAEWLHERVRRHYWGYASDEQLSITEVIDQKFVGIRPAVGYPSLPDQSLNFPIHELLQSCEIGIELTENGVMYPNASTSGLIFAHPESKYFSIGRIDDEQTKDYATRRGVQPEDIAKYLLANRL